MGDATSGRDGTTALRPSGVAPAGPHAPQASAAPAGPHVPHAPHATDRPVVLACGLATLDVVQTVDHVPAANEKLVATALDVAAGGPAANAAVTCALLGVPARLLTRIGAGPLAGAVVTDLADAGVEVVDLASPAARPPVSTVLVTAATGERAVVSVNATGAPPSGLREGSATDLPARLWDGIGLLLVDGHHLDLALAAAAGAQRRGIPVLLDGGSWKPGLEALLAHVDVAVVSADFAVPAQLVPPTVAGDVLDALLRLGPRVAVRSAGAGPLEVATADGARTRVPVPAVAVVDTLGAGDVLHGALAARLATTAQRFAAHEPLPDVVAPLTWAAGVASASCAAPGARGWARDAALLARLRGELGGHRPG